MHAPHSARRECTRTRTRFDPHSGHRIVRASYPAAPGQNLGRSAYLGRCPMGGARTMRVAVVGHVEWIEFARVERVPLAGEIIHALEAWEEPGGGGSVAAVQLAKLAGQCVFFAALGGSGRDQAERYAPGDLEPPPRVVVWTDGRSGGRYRTADGVEGTYPAAPIPGPVVDAYGCGDSFAAGLAFGLGSGLGVEESLALAAKCGAACLTGRGPYAGQLVLRSG